MKYTLLLSVVLFTLNLSAQLRINELMSNNVSAVWDDAFNFSMWVELFNSTSSTLSQSYYYLTDDPMQPRKWQLPSKTIASGGFSVVWMEKPDRAHHAPFNLNPEGGALYLYTSTGTLSDYVVYPAQHRNVSYGRKKDGSDDWIFFEEYSAGFSNEGKASALLRCAKPVLTVPGGLFTTGISLRFETPEPGDTIYFNLNSEEPTRSKSVKYTPGSTILVNSNTIIRAKTFRTGKLSSDITTATYLIGQRNFNLPVVSLVTPGAYLNDNTVGIYVAGTNGITGNGSDRPRNWNQEWDRPANFELFDKNKVSRLNQELDIQIAGGWSRLNAQKSLHVQPKKKFGNNKLEYPVFSSRPNQHYKDIALRNSGNDFRYSMMRDAMMQSLIIGRMDLEYLAYEPAVLYLNGVYYGMQNLRERSNADLLYTTHSLDNEEVKILDQWTIPGDREYIDLLNFILLNDISKASVYEQLKTKMDVDNYINYQIIQIYTGNYDWPHNNIKMWKKNVNGKWRWILFDTDFGFNLYDMSLHTFNSLTYALGENTEKTTQPWATRLFKLLISNESFRNTFIDRFCVHLSTTFKPQRVNFVIDSLASKIRTEISYHKNRWGSDRNFETDISTMKLFSSARAINMLNFIRNRFLYGTEIQTLTLSSNLPGASFTFNGELVRESSVALYSYSGRSFTLKANEVKGYVFKNWELTNTLNMLPWEQTNATSSNIQQQSSSEGSNSSPVISGIVSPNQVFRAIYEEDPTPDPVPSSKVRFNEIVASNSIVKDEFDEKDDYIELYNAGNEPIDISGWFLSDKKSNPRLWKLPSDKQLLIAPKQFLVLWADEQPQQGASHLNFKLSTLGEYISLYAETKFGELMLMDSVTFSSIQPNQAFARYPDGTGNWTVLAPTYLASNVLSSATPLAQNQLEVYPNRFTNYLTIENAGGRLVLLVDIAGKVLRSISIETNLYQMNTDDLPPGLYLLKAGEQSFRQIK